MWLTLYYVVIVYVVFDVNIKIWGIAMKKIQKVAYANVIVISAVVILTGITMLVLRFWGYPVTTAMAICGFLGLLGIIPFWFAQDKEPTDELDIIIQKKAASLGFLIAYLVGGAACMLPFFIAGPKSEVKVAVLPLIFMAMGITHYITFSIVILFSYKKLGGDDE